MRIALFIIAALALVGCGGGSDGTSNDGPREFSVIFANIAHTGVSGRVDPNGIVRVDPRYVSPGLLVHELMHVAGMDTHSENPSCHGYDMAHAITDDPCPSDIEFIRSRDGKWTLIPEPGLWAMTMEAAEFWNFHAGRNVFSVVDLRQTRGQ